MKILKYLIIAIVVIIILVVILPALFGFILARTSIPSKEPKGGEPVVCAQVQVSIKEASCGIKRASISGDGWYSGGKALFYNSGAPIEISMIAAETNLSGFSLVDLRDTPEKTTEYHNTSVTLRSGEQKWIYWEDEIMAGTVRLRIRPKLIGERRHCNDSITYPLVCK